MRPIYLLIMPKGVKGFRWVWAGHRTPHKLTKSSRNWFNGIDIHCTGPKACLLSLMLYIMLCTTYQKVMSLLYIRILDCYSIVYIYELANLRDFIRKSI